MKAGVRTSPWGVAKTPARASPARDSRRKEKLKGGSLSANLGGALQTPFADRLIQRTRELGHPLCAGIDPDLAYLPEVFRRGSMAPGAPETADAVAAFCRAFLARVAGRVAAVKPQSAFFEALGWRGVRVLAELLAEARAAGLLVVLDAKRGDIGSTAEGYAGAYLAEGAPLRADALTVNPWLGVDALEPFLRAAEASGAGLFVLTRTSNPGGRDFQELESGDHPVYEHVAATLAPLAKRLAGASGRWSGLGLVVGATVPEEARRVRELAPDSLFLVPGYGAQGASARDAVAGFLAGPGGRREGGLVNAARSLHFPDGARGGDARAWERAVDDALARAAEDLAEAVAR
jgi:orotidine-5'-phosphate decarboxylase